MEGSSPSKRGRNWGYSSPSRGRDFSNSPKRGNRFDKKFEKNETIVLKNLPRTLEAELLIEKLKSYQVQPETVLYHYDADEKFSGVAMVTYSSIDDAEIMYKELKGLVIEEKKIRVEYKFKRIEDTDEYKDFQNQLKTFKNSEEKELRLDSLTAFQRKQIHQIAEKLHLFHESIQENGVTFINVTKPVRRGFNYPRKDGDSTSRNIATEKKEPQIKPIREPKIPDGTLGFSSEFQTQRRKELRSRGILQGVCITETSGKPVDVTELTNKE